MCLIGHSVGRRKPMCEKIVLEKKANLKQKLHKDAIELSIGQSKTVSRDILTRLLIFNGHVISIEKFPIGLVELKLLDSSTLQALEIKSRNYPSLRNC